MGACPLPNVSLPYIATCEPAVNARTLSETSTVRGYSVPRQSRHIMRRRRVGEEHVTGMLKAYQARLGAAEICRKHDVPRLLGPIFEQNGLGSLYQHRNAAKPTVSPSIGQNAVTEPAGSSGRMTSGPASSLPCPAATPQTAKTRTARPEFAAAKPANRACGTVTP